MLQCIVATNFDLSQDSLPPTVKGSYLLHKFTHPILVHPLSEADAVTFIERKQEHCSLKISEKTIASLFNLSGGIPWVLATAADCAYDNMEANGGEMDGKQTTKAMYQASKPIFRSWCKLLTPAQVEVLKQLTGNIKKNNEYAVGSFTGEQQDQQSAIAILKARGILKRAEYVDEFGNVRKGLEEEVSFNSLLFQRFCREGFMEEAAKRNPLCVKKPEPVRVEPVRVEPARVEPASYEKKASGETVIQVTIGNVEKLITNGGVDQSQTLIAENVQVNQGITPSQILELLSVAGDSRELFAEQLAAQLRKNLLKGTRPQLVREEGVSEEEFAQQYDVEYDRIGQQIVQDIEVDEEQELVDVTPAELQTLETRFAEARRRCRTGLTDEMLEQQSERCQFYIKLSVIVEDALNFPKAFSMIDFSPQLVLYGKALEQALRDNLYELFNKEETLSVHSTYTHKEDRASAEAFRNKPAGRTYIGNYAFLIADKRSYLGSLCSENCVALNGESAPDSWSDWWYQLQQDIHSARAIRNLTDHADEESPDKTLLDSMCDLLFGEGEVKGILERVTVGKQLARLLFPPTIPRAVIEKLVGETCEVKCTTLKKNGGVKAETCDGGYTVNISVKKAQKYRESIVPQEFEPVGGIFRVRILEYKIQDGKEFFCAEILDRVL